MSTPRLSVNVNKVATLRNSRGGSIPSVIDACMTCLDAGAAGITVHPRADGRHILARDVVEIADWLASRRGTQDAEFNIEGDPQPPFLELVTRVRPAQCTLVPVTPGEITSHAGWPPDTDADRLGRVVATLRNAGIRVSLFIDPVPDAVRWAASLGADRIELYTEPFAKAFAAGPDGAGADSFRKYSEAATLARELGLGVNAGHDLDLDNLRLFRRLPHLAEVSIGHALISHALWVGLYRSVRDYLAALSGEDGAL